MKKDEIMGIYSSQKTVKRKEEEETRLRGNVLMDTWIGLALLRAFFNQFSVVCSIHVSR